MHMMNLQRRGRVKGDYFDVYKEGFPTVRAIQISDEFETGRWKRCCTAIDLKGNTMSVDLDGEVEFVIGNVLE